MHGDVQRPPPRSVLGPQVPGRLAGARGDGVADGGRSASSARARGGPSARGSAGPAPRQVSGATAQRARSLASRPARRWRTAADLAGGRRPATARTEPSCGSVCRAPSSSARLARRHLADAVAMPACAAVDAAHERDEAVRARLDRRQHAGGAGTARGSRGTGARSPARPADHPARRAPTDRRRARRQSCSRPGSGASSRKPSRPRASGSRSTRRALVVVGAARTRPSATAAAQLGHARRLEAVHEAEEAARRRSRAGARGRAS